MYSQNTQNIQDFNGLYEEIYVKIAFTEKNVYYRINRFMTITEFINYVRVNISNDFLINLARYNIEVVPLRETNSIHQLPENEPALEPSEMQFQQHFPYVPGNINYKNVFYVRLVPLGITNQNENFIPVYENII